MEFSEKVWILCKKIPKGRVSTYGEIAKKLNTKAYRAVGQALNKSKLIPCHRVIRDTGVIGEYRWGGSRKKALLALESCASEIEADLEDAKNHRR